MHRILVLVQRLVFAALLLVVACGGDNNRTAGSGGGKVAVTVSPASVEVVTGGRQQFTATVTSADQKAVAWSIRENGGGTITDTGLYTAPSRPGTYTIVAKSVADPRAAATAKAIVTGEGGAGGDGGTGGSGGTGGDPGPDVTVSIYPPLIEVVTGETFQFEATVEGSDDQAVTWSVQETNVAGTIDANGVYTAPDTAGSFHIVATSVANPKRSAVASVTVVEPSSTDATGLLPFERRTKWLPGLNAVGGIPLDADPERPARTYLPAGDPFGGFSIDPALGDGSTDARPAIQAALDAAGAQASERDRRIVLLPPGEYQVAGNGRYLQIPSYVTLRGSGTRGPNATRIVQAPGGNHPIVVFGHLWVKNTTPVDLALDAPHGSTQVTVTSNPGYQVGELVFIDQLVDTERVGSWWNPIHQADPEGGPRRWYSRQNRPTGQVLEITAIEGNTLTFATPLRLTYYTSNEAQIVRFSGGQPNGPMVPARRWSGIEDVLVSGGRGGHGNVAFYGAAYSWAKNIESVDSEGSSVSFNSSYRCVLRDSFVHSTANPNPGGAGYGIDLTNYSSDNLIENNISWNFNKVIIFRASGGGNVVGYNYFEDGWGSGYPTIPEVGLNAAHYATPHHELFEGNQAWNIAGDAYWGNTIHVTFFRNHVTGRRRSVPPLNLRDETMRRFVEVPEWQLWSSYIGNVLGFPGMDAAPQSGFVYEDTPPWGTDPVPMWQVGKQHNAGLNGQDEQVVEQTIRHGNFDYVSNDIVWDSEIERRDLPPSLYLHAKPAFFGELPWPWIVPESETKETIATLPARQRFDQLMGL